MPLALFKEFYKLPLVNFHIKIIMLEVKNITKKFGDFVAVNNISFTASKGEIVGFLGPNGAGKTTTIRMLSTFMPPTSGTATIAGYDIRTQADEVRKKIGYLPDTPPLYPEMTVTEYLKFVAEIKGVTSSKMKAALNNALELCLITDVRNKLCQHLSRGYRQRVGIAQAIIHDPEVVILDEPTSGLDPRQIIEIRKTIAGLKEGRTVILSTHILPEVSMVCDKVVIINRGEIALQQPIGQLTESGKTLEQVFLEVVSTEQPVQQAL